MSGAPELVIFDCDGVLVDSEIISFQVEAAAFAGIGIPLTAEDLLRRFVGTSSAGMFAIIEREHGRKLPADFGAQVSAQIRAAFDRGLKAIPGIAELLAGLALPKCVASSSDPDRIRHSLGLAGIRDHFEPHIFSATQVERGKPAPDLFLFAAGQMGAAPERCLVIEDSVPGVTAARAAGMTVLGFSGAGHCRPGHDARLRAAGARAAFGSMRNLADHLAAAAG